MKIDLDILEQVPSLNVQPEVDLWRHIRHVEKSIWCHNSAVGWPICMKSGTPMQFVLPMTMNRLISKPEVVTTQPEIEISHRNLVCRYQTSAVKHATNSRFAIKWPPSWKDMADVIRYTVLSQNFHFCCFRSMAYIRLWKWVQFCLFNMNKFIKLHYVSSSTPVKHSGRLCCRR